jgi:hypothetical protein
MTLGFTTLKIFIFSIVAVTDAGYRGIKYQRFCTFTEDNILFHFVTLP